jgi:putative oxidoreductase
MGSRLRVDPGWGITAVRLATGFVLAIHGYDKVARGLGPAIDYFGRVGIPLPGLAAPAIALLELGGGILLLVGALTRWLGLLFAIEFLVIVLWIVLPGTGRLRGALELMLLAASILLAVSGPGRMAVRRD